MPVTIKELGGRGLATKTEPERLVHPSGFPFGNTMKDSPVYVYVVALACDMLSRAMQAIKPNNFVFMLPPYNLKFPRIMTLTVVTRCQCHFLAIYDTSL
jgi:hypothetical protein